MLKKISDKRCKELSANNRRLLRETKEDLNKKTYMPCSRTESCTIIKMSILPKLIYTQSQLESQ